MVIGLVLAKTGTVLGPTTRINVSVADNPLAIGCETVRVIKLLPVRFPTGVTTRLEGPAPFPTNDKLLDGTGF